MLSFQFLFLFPFLISFLFLLVLVQDSKPQVLASVAPVTYDTLTLDTLDFRKHPSSSSSHAAPSSPKATKNVSFSGVAHPSSSAGKSEAPAASASSSLPPCPFVESLVSTLSLDCVPLYAETEVNTESVLLASKGCLHVEGAWPKEVDPRYIDSVMRYKRKIEKSPLFSEFVARASESAGGVLALNNAIDLYEEYFRSQKGRQYEYSQPTAKIVRVFKDPAASAYAASASASAAAAAASAGGVGASAARSATAGGGQEEFKRTASCISWHPES